MLFILDFYVARWGWVILALNIITIFLDDILIKSIYVP